MGLRTKIGVEQRDLPVRMTEAAHAQRGRDLALALQERASHDEQEKSVRATLKAQAEEINQRIAGLRDVVASGCEPQPVACEVWGEHDEGIVRIVRMDTGEVLEVRAMTAEEKQMPFDFIDCDKPGDDQIGPDREQ